MSLDKGHIDLEQLQSYFEGKLSVEEMHALEMRAQSDPFLYEAMEGFDENPAGLNQVEKLKKKELLRSKSFFGSRTITVLLVACLVYVVALLIQPDVPENNYLTEQDDASEVSEVEVIPLSIDTFEYASEEEQITISEITDNKKLIQESQEHVSDPLENPNDIIDIDDPVIEDDHDIIPEGNHQEMTNYAPSIYQHELYVVDYRKLNRKRNEISYTKYELSGVSAQFEDENARDNQDLIEKQVEIPYMEYLETSMRYFSHGKYKKALNRYTTILEQYPHDLNAHFYGALCYYGLKQYDKSLSYFNAVLEDEQAEGFVAFREEAKWYKAKTLVKLGKKNDARIVLDEIIMEGLFYSKDAITLKSKL